MVPHISEMPHDKVNIEGFRLSGWNTRKFYYLPLADLYFLKFLKGMHTDFVIKRGSEATDNTLEGGVLALSERSQERPGQGAFPGKL